MPNLNRQPEQTIRTKEVKHLERRKSPVGDYNNAPNKTYPKGRDQQKY